MKKVILDTNFLMAVAQFRIDIFSEIKRVCDFPYKICIIDRTVDELNNIVKNQRGKDKDAAKLALSLIKSKDIEKLKTDKGSYVDLLLLDQKDAVIATQDRELRAKLKEKNIHTLMIRQKKYIIFG